MGSYRQFPVLLLSWILLICNCTKGYPLTATPEIYYFKVGCAHPTLLVKHISRKSWRLVIETMVPPASYPSHHMMSFLHLLYHIQSIHKTCTVIMLFMPIITQQRQHYSTAMTTKKNIVESSINIRSLRVRLRFLNPFNLITIITNDTNALLCLMTYSDALMAPPTSR